MLSTKGYRNTITQYLYSYNTEVSNKTARAPSPCMHAFLRPTSSQQGESSGQNQTIKPSSLPHEPASPHNMQRRQHAHVPRTKPDINPLSAHRTTPHESINLQPITKQAAQKRCIAKDVQPHPSSRPQSTSRSAREAVKMSQQKERKQGSKAERRRESSGNLPLLSL
ncbi:hypothetical protein BDY21DRAFT_356434 [Lineolata rhizophorae]|uniref:Uncharacterized protein n=1 Tax=Lineolata rhizophorae TaxID=578093 RepID=A0A6A6NNR7_9PEZI|nr:hypothetical protein BDY21DRAFT_356434 [Lineolata rhizophorae]